ncbi:chemotaxis protein CheW, partial [Vibrio sp. 10N.286.49.B3]|uniref:chemotaxis protein CheW n=1 Tax=Vibrio sp. 10N.286.49.B3 TaxID=1880855 RepID=UPI000C85B6A9
EPEPEPELVWFDEPIEPDFGDVERLLSQVSLTVPAAPVDELQEWDIYPITENACQNMEDFSHTNEYNTESSVEVVGDTQPLDVSLPKQSKPEPVWESSAREQEFQVLYFEVNGVIFAVPLDELGGIHQLSDVNHLIGRPEWYLGLQTTHSGQLDVVDTACWVMADKLDNQDYQESYQYIVLLGESRWGLACSELKGTELVQKHQIRWREKAGKRPWLAGMVTNKMCALIHVEAMITMLNSGLDVKALN